MGGSTVAQFLYQAYGDVAVEAAKGLTANMLTAVAPYLKAAVALAVLIVGKKTLSGNVSSDEWATRFARIVIVVLLLTAGAFDQYITTTLTTTIPDFITNAGSGGQNLTGAQGDDALINAVENFTAQVRSQIGVLYISDRIVVWLAQIGCNTIVLACLSIRILAKNAIVFLLPIVPPLMPFYLFDATRDYTMRLVGMFIGLSMVMLLALLLGAFVVKQNALYLQQYAKAVASSRANDGFTTNGGDVPFTAFQMGELGPGGQLGGAGAAVAAGGTSNGSEGINTLVRILCVFLFGLLELGLITTIAMVIGMTGGFSPTAAITAATSAVSYGVSRMAGHGSRRTA